MKDTERIFNNISLDCVLSNDFEDEVFAKIGKKKRQRKAVVSFVSGFCFAALLYLGYTVIPSIKKSDSGLIAKQSAPRFNDINIKKEVPLTEDLYLTSSGKDTNYLIEKVSLETEEESSF